AAAPASNCLIIESPLPEERRGLSAARGVASSNHRLQRCQSVGLCRRFVDANPADARKAHRDSGFVPRALVDRIEGDLEDKALLDLAHRTKALHGVAADPAV